VRTRLTFRSYFITAGQRDERIINHSLLFLDLTNLTFSQNACTRQRKLRRLDYENSLASSFFLGDFVSNEAISFTMLFIIAKSRVISMFLCRWRVCGPGFLLWNSWPSLFVPKKEICMFLGNDGRILWCAFGKMESNHFHKLFLKDYHLHFYLFGNNYENRNHMENDVTIINEMDISEIGNNQNLSIFRLNRNEWLRWDKFWEFSFMLLSIRLIIVRIRWGAETPLIFWPPGRGCAALPMRRTLFLINCFATGRRFWWAGELNLQKLIYS